VPDSSDSLHAQTRRALVEDIREDKKGWLQHGIAALAVSLLGLGIAGSVVLTGAAQQSTTTGANTISQVSAADRAANSTSRSKPRAAMDPAEVQSLADQRAEELSKAGDKVTQSAKDQAARARDTALADESNATTEQAKLIIRARAAAAAAKAAADAKAAAQAAAGARTAPAPAPASVPRADNAPTTPDPAPQASSGKSCLPITGGFSIAARFGQIGTWSRYHTGMDFSAPVGTQLHAPSAGVVTSAGIGPASSWAGNYVAIRYSDGTQTLMAHMSTVSVRVGQTVSACQLVGAVGMTGRTFGPHVHFEVYPAGITPGDLYRAVNPVGWLNARGLQL